jgi:hypothetical protein
MKAGSVLMDGDATEVSDRGVQQDADKVEGDKVLFSTRESPRYNALPTLWLIKLVKRVHFS